MDGRGKKVGQLSSGGIREGGRNISFYLHLLFPSATKEKWEAKGFVDQAVGARSEFAMPVFFRAVPTHGRLCQNWKRHPPRALFSD